MPPSQPITLNPQPVLEAEGLCIGYRRRGRADVVVLEGADLALQAGRLVCLLGPNGSGKSTLLRTLAGVQRPLGGGVRLLGEDLHALSPRHLARRMSLVLTERIGVGNLSVYALVALGRHPHTGWMGRLSREDEARVAEALRAVGMTSFAGRAIGTLSDGERQKVMIARALAQDPAVMLLDEPTAHLDLPNRLEVMRVLRRLAHETGRAILLSTHELNLALQAADVVWLLPQEGPLRQGMPEELVLDGVLEQTFQHEGAWFDRATGTFRLHEPFRGPVGLAGAGAERFWTMRALERLGFEVRLAAHDLPLRVEVVCCDERSGWVLRRGTERAYFERLGELVRALSAGAGAATGTGDDVLPVAS